MVLLRGNYKSKKTGGGRLKENSFAKIESGLGRGLG
jgi:hypothetical protein